MRFRLNQPDSAFAHRLTLGIVPAEAVATPAPLETSEFSTKPVGTGPYRLVEWRQGSLLGALAEHVVVLRHALPTALLPFVTLLGTRIPELVTGAVLVETVFSWPGIAEAVVTTALAVAGIAAWWRDRTLPRRRSELGL